MTTRRRSLTAAALCATMLWPALTEDSTVATPSRTPEATNASAQGQDIPVAEAKRVDRVATPKGVTTPAPTALAAAPASETTGRMSNGLEIVRLQTARGPVEVIADELLVTLRPDAGPDGLAVVARDTGLKVRGQSVLAWVGRLVVDPDERAEATARVAAHSLVQHAGPHAVMRGAGGDLVPRPSEISRKRPDGFALGGKRLHWSGDNDDAIVAVDATMDGPTADTWEIFQAKNDVFEGAELWRDDVAELLSLREWEEAIAESALDAAELNLENAEIRVEVAEKADELALDAIEDAVKALEDAEKDLVDAEEVAVEAHEDATAAAQEAADALASATTKQEDKDKAVAEAEEMAQEAAEADAGVETGVATVAARRAALDAAEAARVAPAVELAFALELEVKRNDELEQRKNELETAEDLVKSAKDLLKDADEDMLLAASYMLLAQNDYFEASADNDKTKVGDEAPLEWLQWTLDHLGLKDAVREGISGKGIAIAVLDTGVAYEDRSDATGTYARAPDLNGVTFFGAWDFVNNDPNANDDNGHGTQMTTTMVGLGATLPIAGNASILPIKVLDADKVGTELSLIEGIVWAVDNDADVINMSLAFPAGYVPSPVLEQAIAYAHENGVVMVAATGNDGDDGATYPAGFPEVLAVGAYVPLELADGKIKGRRANYTNSSSILDIVAPAGAPDSDDDGDGYADGAVSMTFSPGDPLTFGYWLLSGTSVAAAETSAVVALMLEAGEKPGHIATRLHRTADAGAVGGGFDDGNGAGRLDAGKAVDETLRKAWGDECMQGVTTANVSGAIIAPSDDDRQGVFRVELQWASAHNLKDAKVVVRIQGATDERLTVKSAEGKNYAEFKTKKVKAADFPDGLHWEVDVDGVILPKTELCPEWLSRPVSYVHVDESSFLFLANLGTGMASSSIIARLDARAAKSLSSEHGSVYELRYSDTYLHRSFGTGMISSARVAIFDRSYLESKSLLERSFVFRSHGTGMASSSIIVDEDFMSPSLRLRSSRKLTIRSFPRGTGLASGSVRAGGASMGLGYYLDQLNTEPAILRVNHGGVQSEVVVVDRSLVSPDLASDDIDAFVAETAAAAEIDGAGMASSSRIFILNAFNVSQLGYNWNTLQARYLTGTGMISSALVAGNLLTAWSPRFSAFTTPRIGLGMSLEGSVIVANGHRAELETWTMTATGTGDGVLRAVTVDGDWSWSSLVVP